MTTKYTPGPWAVHYHEDSDSYTIHVAGRNWDGWDVWDLACASRIGPHAQVQGEGARAPDAPAPLLPEPARPSAGRPRRGWG